MKCLCCGGAIPTVASEQEKKSKWHSSCVRAFFGGNQLPEIQLDVKALEAFARKAVDNGVTVTGVQKKISLGFSKNEKDRLTMIDFPTGYILKPQTEDYEELPEYEYLAMRMAQKSGIKTVPYGLIELRKERAYITKRIDRRGDIPYGMEDFCQLAGKITFDKYRGSYELCARMIKKYSSRRGLDLSELFMRVVFSYLTGNSDMHLKNLSLIETAPGAREYALSPAYDILPVNVILPEDKDELALALNGKKRNIRRKDFIIFAESCDIKEKAAEKIIDKICSFRDVFLNECDESYLSKENIQKEKELIEGRYRVLM